MDSLIKNNIPTSVINEAQHLVLSIVIKTLLAQFELDLMAARELDPNTAEADVLANRFIPNITPKTTKTYAESKAFISLLTLSASTLTSMVNGLNRMGSNTNYLDTSVELARSNKVSTISVALLMGLTTTKTNARLQDFGVEHVFPRNPTHKRQAHYRLINPDHTRKTLSLFESYGKTFNDLVTAEDLSNSLMWSYENLISLSKCYAIFPLVPPNTPYNKMIINHDEALNKPIMTKLQELSKTFNGLELYNRVLS